MTPVVIAFLASTIRIATPMLFAALGAILTEQSGIFAVGVEGMMRAGAFAAAVTTAATDSALVGGTVALIALRFGADQMVTGLAANMLAAGATSFLLRIALHDHGPAIRLTLLSDWPIPGLAAIPVAGPLLFHQQPLTYAGFAAFMPLAWFMSGTHTGLRLRAVGENPAAAFVAGADPVRIRLTATIGGAAIAGLRGAMLVLQQVGTFTDGMTGGRGFLALAAVIVGRCQPAATVAACLVFAAAEALELRVEQFGLTFSSYSVEMLPYLVAVLVLAAFGRSGRMPAALGRRYRRDTAI